MADRLDALFREQARLLPELARLLALAAGYADAPESGASDAPGPAGPDIVETVPQVASPGSALPPVALSSGLPRVALSALRPARRGSAPGRPAATPALAGLAPLLAGAAGSPAPAASEAAGRSRAILPTVGNTSTKPPLVDELRPVLPGEPAACDPFDEAGPPSGQPASWPAANLAPPAPVPPVPVRRARLTPVPAGLAVGIAAAGGSAFHPGPDQSSPPAGYGPAPGGVAPAAAAPWAGTFRLATTGSLPGRGTPDLPTDGFEDQLAEVLERAAAEAGISLP